MLKNKASAKEIREAFDALSHQERLNEMYQFDSHSQALLFDLVTGQDCSFDFFVPPSRLNEEVIHWGQNSLPLFSKFQKRMAAIEGVNGIEYSGYNEQLMKALTGPGYFQLADNLVSPGGRKQLFVDYINLPSFKLDSWPAIIPNSARLSRVIYYQTRDWMWQVSEHVSIGRASRQGRWMDNWFLLCRED